MGDSRKIAVPYHGQHLGILRKRGEWAGGGGVIYLDWNPKGMWGEGGGEGRVFYEWVFQFWISR